MLRCTDRTSRLIIKRIFRDIDVFGAFHISREVALLGTEPGTLALGKSTENVNILSKKVHPINSTIPLAIN